MLKLYKTAAVKVEEEYTVPIEVHNPMEMHAITAMWDGDDKVTVYEKTQGVKSTQRIIAATFKLKEENVKVYAPFVGGGFGSALRTWPHTIAALMGAKKNRSPHKAHAHPHANVYARRLPPIHPATTWFGCNGRR